MALCSDNGKDDPKSGFSPQNPAPNHKTGGFMIDLNYT